MRRLAILLLMTFAATATSQADIVRGHEAFISGEFETAYRELFPLVDDNVLATYYVGQMYMDGLGVTRDRDTGLGLLHKAAEAGQTGAQLRVAHAYEYGEGVEQNYRVAADWMLESAAGGNAAAQYYLGQYYYDGKGVVRDDVLAFEWTLRSVAYGVSHPELVDALLFLGAACEWGRGLRQDLVEAYKWFSLASSYSTNDVRIHDEASRALDALRIRMNAPQLELARRSAQVWLNEKRDMYGVK